MKPQSGHSWVSGEKNLCAQSLSAFEEALGSAVQVSGLPQLKFTAGSTSHHGALPVRTNQARLEQNGTDVTAQIVTYP